MTGASRYRDAMSRKDYDAAVLYAGISVGEVTAIRPAGDIVREICAAAERALG